MGQVNKSRKSPFGESKVQNEAECVGLGCVDKNGTFKLTSGNYKKKNIIVVNVFFYYFFFRLMR